MNELGSWPDGEDAELRELLAFGEAPRPLDGAVKERSRRRVLALAAVPAAAGVLFWIQQFAFGALLGGAVSVGVAAAGGVFSPDESEPAPVVAVRPAAPGVRADVRRDLASPPEPRATIAEPGRVPAAPAPGESASPAFDGGVAGEVRLLEAARRALEADPARALELLGRHERDFPAGVLVAEREVLAIDALVRSGRSREAAARGRGLRERMPGSLYEERIERILEKGEQ